MTPQPLVPRSDLTAFLVTTTRPCPEGHSEPVQTGDGGGWDGGGNYHCPPCKTCDDRCEVYEHRAVATLSEAQFECIKAHPHFGKCWRVDDPQIDALSTLGGTVGPFSDGTVVEVVPITEMRRREIEAGAL